MLNLNDKPRPDLSIERTLARVDDWRCVELSDGQRVFVPDDPNADPADCPVGALFDVLKAKGEALP